LYAKTEKDMMPSNIIPRTIKFPKRMERYVFSIFAFT
jgi:hypothetical protein